MINKLYENYQLELRDNLLDGCDFSTLVSLYPSLEKLKVGKNSIKGIEVFKPLSGLKNLRKLEYTECLKNDKRDEVFKLIPSLTVINGFSTDNEEVESTIDIEGNKSYCINIFYNFRGRRWRIQYR